MKDSGIPWIGEIPEGWEVRRVKDCSTFVNGYAFDSNSFSKQGNTAVIRIGDIVGDGVSFENVVYVDNNPALQKFKINKNDLLIAMSGATVGKTAMVYKDENAYINQRVGIIRNSNISFIKRMFETNGFQEYIILSSLGAAQPNISAKGILNYNIPFPSQSEQQAIANYLDRKTQQLDATVEREKQHIEKLKQYRQSLISETVTKGLEPSVPMRDSGIPWIGEIPEGWDVKKLKFSCQVFGRIGFRGYKSADLVSEGEGAITLSPSNMDESQMNYTKMSYLSWNKYFESPEIMIQNGDILMVKTGSTYGKNVYVDDLPMESTINPQIVVLKNHKDNSKFLAYSFQTSFTKKQVEESVVGGTIPTIAQEKILNYLFIFPSLHEQQTIADYLDRKTAQIDAVLAKKETLIAKLLEYKKSLIYEAVTGKLAIEIND